MSEARDIIPLPPRRVDRERDDDAPLTDAERKFYDWLLVEALKQWKSE